MYFQYFRNGQVIKHLGVRRALVMYLFLSVARPSPEVMKKKSWSTQLSNEILNAHKYNKSAAGIA